MPEHRIVARNSDAVRKATGIPSRRETLSAAEFVTADENFGDAQDLGAGQPGIDGRVRLCSVHWLAN